jgi:hypothetical protein
MKIRFLPGLVGLAIGFALPTFAHKQMHQIQNYAMHFLRFANSLTMQCPIAMPPPYRPAIDGLGETREMW